MQLGRRSSILIICLLFPLLSCSTLRTILPEYCDECGRKLNPRSVFEVDLKGGQRLRLCCARCGLHFLEGRKDVVGTRVADYFSKEMIDTQKAFFVVGSSVRTCGSSDEIKRDAAGESFAVDWDRCLPSTIGFSSRQRATAFLHKYGGQMYLFNELTMTGSDETAVFPQE